MTISKKALCIIACLIIGISNFFPFLQASFFGTTIAKSLADGGDGYIILVIAVIALIFSACGKYIPSIILGVISFGFFILENANVSSNLGEGSGYARAMLQNGLGYYLLLIGSILLVVFSVMGLVDKKKEKATTNNSSNDTSSSVEN